MPQAQGGRIEHSRIELSKISISRGGRPVIVNSTASFVGPVLLTGPNGSGKTTLLEMIAGILPLESGTVCSDGVEIQPTSIEWRSQVSYSPADGGTIPVLTVNDQLSLAGLLDGLPTTEATRRINAVVALFGLGGHENHRADHLSTGLAKRLTLAIAAMRSAPIYLFDEPTAGVDEMGVAVVGRLLDELVGSGRTVVVATHSRSLLPAREIQEWRLVDSVDSPVGSVIESTADTASPRSVAHGADDFEPSLPWLWTQ